METDVDFNIPFFKAFTTLRDIALAELFPASFTHVPDGCVAGLSLSQP